MPHLKENVEKKFKIAAASRDLAKPGELHLIIGL